MPDTLPQFALLLNANLSAAQPWRALVQGVTDSTVLDQVGIIQADQRPIVVRFLKATGNGLTPFAAYDPLVGGGSVLFGAKAKSNLSAAEYLFACSAFTRKDDGAGDIWYEGTLNLYTEPLEAAFATTDEVEFLADIEIDTGAGLKITVAQLSGLIRRQVVDSATAPPATTIGGTFRIYNNLFQLLNQTTGRYQSVVIQGEPGSETLAIIAEE